jgi:hypothetical protein
VGTIRRVAYTPLHITSPARDTQYCATSPEPFLSAVFSIHNVHMYTLNKISILLLLVLITSYCVGLSTASLMLSIEDAHMLNVFGS